MSCMKQKGVTPALAAPGDSIQYRPCLINGRKALFHKWEHKSIVIPPSPLRGGHSGGVEAYDLAIVEYEDGTVGEVIPSSIQFTQEVHVDGF